MEHAKLQYRKWQAINNVLTISTVASMSRLLENNPIVTVSEKLRGYTVCMSSKGWMGNVDVDHSLRPAFDALCNITKELQILLMDRDMQVMLYGKWQTRYIYKSRQLLPRQFYAFGLGILPGHWDHKISPKLKQLFDWNVTFVNEKAKP